MKTAIASTGNSPDAVIDKRFGRCNYFVIHNTEDRSTEYIPNPYADAEENAGSDSVMFLASRGVLRIISGEFGLKIKSLLDKYKIQMIVIQDRAKTIGEIISLLENNS